MAIYKGVDYFEGSRPTDRRFQQSIPKKTWQVSKIWESHEEIIRRMTLGQKNIEIASAMNISPAQVSNVRNSPIIQDKLAIMKGARDAYTLDIARDIREFAPKALEVLKDIVNGQDASGLPIGPGLKARVASDLLDRAGYAPVRNVSVQSVHAHLTRDDIEELKKRAIGANGPVIEIHDERSSSQIVD